jgi:hypothetical protein
MMKETGKFRQMKPIRPVFRLIVKNESKYHYLASFSYLERH